MNILLNFGRKTSIMEQEQCCGCNRGCNKEELVSCCEGKLCPECFDYDTNCPNCDKPNKSMHKTVRNKGSMYDLEKNEGNADDKQFGLTPFEQKSNGHGYKDRQSRRYWFFEKFGFSV